MEMKQALELKGISLSFGRKKKRVDVLEQVSLTVGPEEFVSIIGPSGCGKSTLFHIIGGLLDPDQGDVYLNGQLMTGQKGMISYMPQQPALFPWRTIEENVILAKEVAGAPIRMAKEEARKWLAQVGLEGYEKSYPHELSGGMQQRVAFLRALLSDKQLMCLDEPFSALDALTRIDMQRWLLHMWERNKRSVLFVTHHMEEALLLSDVIYVLSAKPAIVLERIEVPFARPRPEEIVHERSFLDLKQYMYDLMKQG